jgi:hypothetical protein
VNLRSRNRINHRIQANLAIRHGQARDIYSPPDIAAVLIPTRQIGVRYPPSLALAKLNSGHARLLKRKRGLLTYYVGSQTAVLVLS